ncbi:hypothetical protein L208DRAFT_1497033 [Tricholoma matsutake]|nr:hypothetical protein L208DRAFT_1497033 [Tricholoma matsutake 945]
MPDNQTPAATSGLQQTTLSENPNSIQKRANPVATTPELSAKEKQPAHSQVEKGRITRQTEAVPQSGANLGDIMDAEAGLSWLAAKGLMAPSGSTPSMTLLAETLFQVGALPNTPLQMLNGIRAVAFLLQELELMKTTREVTTTVLKELISLVDTIQNMFKEKTEECMASLLQTTKEVIMQAKETTEELGKATEKMISTAEKEKTPATPYRDALNQGTVGPPVRVDPRVRAKEGIRARQFLWTLSVDIPELKTLPAPQLLKQLNEKLTKAAKMTNEECKLHLAMWLKNGGLLIEAGDDKSAAWLCSEANILHMECELGTSILLEARNFNTMAYFVPLTFDVSEKTHIEEVMESNDLSKDAISKCRWVKAPGWWNPNQMVGHMIITFTDPDSANKAILGRLVICNKKVSVTKCKREPIRCLKCQEYNHVVHKCIISRDICARCRENHRTSDCSAATLLCTPCGKRGHASNDRTCPTFLRKCNEHNERNLENLLPFYPSTEIWTWEAAPPSNQRAATTTGLTDFV